MTTLPCPECGAPMVRRTTRFGPMYGCSTYPKCGGSHGCHADGTPFGIPANKETKAARIRAHAKFDALWQKNDFAPRKLMKRSEAYAWMQKAMGFESIVEAHIGRFNKEQCEKLITLVTKYLEGT